MATGINIAVPISAAGLPLTRSGIIQRIENETTIAEYHLRVFIT